MHEPKNEKKSPSLLIESSQVGLEEDKEFCFVHEKCSNNDKWIIQKDVCCDLPISEFEGKDYCVLHLPNPNKFEKTDFSSVIVGRIQSKKTDFSYIYVPNAATFFGKHFTSEVVFKNTTFLGQADFRNLTFENKISFKNAIFEEKAIFTNTTFKDYVDFTNTKFKGEVDFSNANFEIVNFDSVTFDKKAKFLSTIFNSNTNYNFSEFKEESDFTSAEFIKKVDFKTTTFRGNVNFNLLKFKGESNFENAKFFGDANFNTVKFQSKAQFESVTFEHQVTFKNSVFEKNAQALFYKSKFNGDTFFDKTIFTDYVTFNSAILGSDSDVFFRETIFEGKVNFRYCNSGGYLRFDDLKQGKENSFVFDEAAFEKANRISFHTMWLEPNWFVNVDPRKFVFTDIDWGKTIKWRTGRSFWEKLKFAGKCVASGFRQLFWKSDEILSENIDGELKRLEERGIKEQKKRLLEIACRQLAVNAEENNRYSEASQFRYMAMETKRLENKGIWRFLNLHWFYKWTSGYGESWRRALVVLVAILAIFGFLYSTPLANFDYGEKPPKKVESFVQQVCNLATMKGNAGGLNGCDSAFYSLAVSALQKPEPKPADSLTKFLVILQTILAPLQAALLALAIRRKFMR